MRVWSDREYEERKRRAEPTCGEKQEHHRKRLLPAAPY